MDSRPLANAKSHGRLLGSYSAQERPLKGPFLFYLRKRCYADSRVWLTVPLDLLIAALLSVSDDHDLLVSALFEDLSGNNCARDIRSTERRLGAIIGEKHF